MYSSRLQEVKCIAEIMIEEMFSKVCRLNSRLQNELLIKQNFVENYRFFERMDFVLLEFDGLNYFKNIKQSLYNICVPSLSFCAM